MIGRMSRLNDTRVGAGALAAATAGSASDAMANAVEKKGEVGKGNTAKDNGIATEAACTGGNLKASTRLDKPPPPLPIGQDVRTINATALRPGLSEGLTFLQVAGPGSSDRCMKNNVGDFVIRRCGRVSNVGAYDPGRGGLK